MTPTTWLLTIAAAALLVALLPGPRGWFRARKYKSGTGWCLWRWTDVDSEYILRLHVLKTPWFAVCLHWINKPDAEPYLHDHPVSFLSLILKGTYGETRARGPRWGVYEHHRWWNVIRARRDDRHRISWVSPGGALTLCFMGPKVQEWGFTLEDGSWQYWKDYYAKQRLEKAAAQHYECDTAYNPETRSSK